MTKKKKRQRQPHTEQRPAAPDGPPTTISLFKYTITHEPIPDEALVNLPEHVKDALERLYTEVQIRPRQALPELKKLKARYPKVLVLYNYLSAAYMAAGMLDEGRAMIRENYEKNPDYLFARLNYAQLFYDDGDYEKVAEIFDHKFDLKLLYPDRDEFHITEFANFAGLIALYFIEVGRREEAERYYEILSEIAPDFVFTEQLKRRLKSLSIDRLLGNR